MAKTSCRAYVFLGLIVNQLRMTQIDLSCGVPFRIGYFLSLTVPCINSPFSLNIKKAFFNFIISKTNAGSLKFS